MCRDETKRKAESRERRAEQWLVLHSPVFAILLALAGCAQDMTDQPRYEPLEESAFFADQQSSRPLVSGTVPRGHLRTDEEFYTGKVGAKLVEAIPLEKVAKKVNFSGSQEEMARQVLERGRKRFDIFCAPCHGRVGSGEKGLEGMVVKRGFPQPPSYHTDRLRNMPVGHFYDVITHGFGRMPSHASKIPPADRWAIVAYVRALQLSQNAPFEQLPEEDRQQLERVQGSGVRSAQP